MTAGSHNGSRVSGNGPKVCSSRTRNRTANGRICVEVRYGRCDSFCEFLKSDLEYIIGTEEEVSKIGGEWARKRASAAAVVEFRKRVLR